MAITIDGDNGISGVNGTATTPALQGTDSNTGIVFGTDEVSIATGGSTRATVDSSGRVLIGTSTEGEANADDLQLESSANGNNIRAGTTSSNSNIYFADGTSAPDVYAGYIQLSHSSDTMKFGIQGNDAMYIDSSRRLFVGSSSAPSSNSENLFQVVHADGPSLILGRGNSGCGAMTTGHFIRFFANDPSGYNQVAAILCDADGAHASSDYPTRLEFYTVGDWTCKPRTGSDED